MAEARHPKYLLLENVPGLLTHEGGQTFLAILTALEQLGYSLEWCVVNSANFGVPQDRKRVYIVGYLDSRLRDALMRIQGRFLLSYNDCPEIRELYSRDGIMIESTTRLSNIAQRYDAGKQYPELFISNYDTYEEGWNAKQLTLFDDDSISEKILKERKIVWNIGRKVFGKFLKDDEHTHFYRDEFLGIADESKLPEWATQKLEKIRAGEDEGMVLS